MVLRIYILCASDRHLVELCERNYVFRANEFFYQSVNLYSFRVYDVYMSLECECCFVSVCKHFNILHVITICNSFHFINSLYLHK
jgi:hypothetical protein